MVLPSGTLSQTPGKFCFGVLIVETCYQLSSRKVDAQDFTEARDSEWQWHQLGRVVVCTSLQTDNHASTPPLSFLQAGCPSCRPTNSVKALKAKRARAPWLINV